MANPQSSTFNVFARTISGTSYKLQVDPSMDVWDLKKQIEQKCIFRTPFEFQKISTKKKQNNDIYIKNKI